MLSRYIENAIKERGLTQGEAARLLGTTQPKVSDVVRGNLGRYSLPRLFRYLNALGMDVRITVTPAESRDPPGQVIVEGC